jgi:hypothetical protein
LLLQKGKQTTHGLDVVLLLCEDFAVFADQLDVRMRRALDQIADVIELTTTNSPLAARSDLNETIVVYGSAIRVGTGTSTPDT